MAIRSSPATRASEPRGFGLPYNRSKLLGEQAVRDGHKQTGLPLTIVRPVSVYGPRSKDCVIEIGSCCAPADDVHRRGSIPAGFLYIDNAVDGIIAAASSPRTYGLVYNLRDGSNETWREYVDALAAGMKTKPVRMSIRRGSRSASRAHPRRSTAACASSRGRCSRVTPSI